MSYQEYTFDEDPDNNSPDVEMENRWQQRTSRILDTANVYREDGARYIRAAFREIQADSPLRHIYNQILRDRLANDPHPDIHALRTGAVAAFLALIKNAIHPKTNENIAQYIWYIFTVFKDKPTESMMTFIRSLDPWYDRFFTRNMDN